MIPLRVTAKLRGGVETIFGRIGLDSLLMAAVCMRDGIPPALTPADVRPIDIPVQLSDCGRFYLSSFSIGDVEERERLVTYRRFPGVEAMLLGPRTLNRVTITTGVGKSFVMPHELQHMVNDTLTWFCIGEPAEVRALLSLIMYVGKNRKIGHGAIERWTIEPCEAWAGFPVCRDGKALRPLPLDYPGLVHPLTSRMALRPPYDVRRNPDRPLCAVPR